MDYKNGRIYKITSDSTDKIYIGSTCQSLSKRMTTHRENQKAFEKGKGTNCSSYELITLGDAIITLIEDYPCERKEQLRMRERYYIELNKDICINKCKRPIITNDERLTTMKEYHIKNKDIIQKRLNTKIICECGGQYTKVNKAKHEQTIKHIAFINSQS